MGNDVRTYFAEESRVAGLLRQHRDRDTVGQFSAHLERFLFHLEVFESEIKYETADRGAIANLDAFERALVKIFDEFFAASRLAFEQDSGCSKLEEVKREVAHVVSSVREDLKEVFRRHGRVFSSESVLSEMPREEALGQLQRLLELVAAMREKLSADQFVLRELFDVSSRFLDETKDELEGLLRWK